MLNIKNLEVWAQKTGGTFTTSSTITLKNKDIDITVHGKTVEEALQKLNSTFENSVPKQEVQQLDIQPKAPETLPSKQITQTPQTIQQAQTATNVGGTSVNNNGSSSNVEPFQSSFFSSQNDLSKLLAGRRLVKIADGTPLNPNEEIIEYGGMNYVVAPIGK